MSRVVPRVAAIHDLSCFGRSSLTVLIPVLSSLGVQVCPVPTAVLSTQTDGFEDFFFADTSNFIKGIDKHWSSLGINFDCIYSGFLGSALQIELSIEFIDHFCKNEKPLIVVDPVMGDNGCLYSTYTSELQNKMHYLVEKADVITPNLTEAYFLIGERYTDKPVNTPVIKRYLKQLSDIGPETVIIKGIHMEDGNYANVGYCRNLGLFYKVLYQHIPVHYPGTGDVFTSVLTGSLLRGDELPVALNKATKFISLAIQTTYEHGTPEREGVLLEMVLEGLYSEPGNNGYEIL